MEFGVLEGGRRVGSGVRIRKLLTRASGTPLASRLGRNKILAFGQGHDDMVSHGGPFLGHFWLNCGAFLVKLWGMFGQIWGVFGQIWEAFGQISLPSLGRISSHLPSSLGRISSPAPLPRWGRSKADN